jgi:hypothetical protein
VVVDNQIENHLEMNLLVVVVDDTLASSRWCLYFLRKNYSRVSLRSFDSVN